jgi:hypothetical protein
LENGQRIESLARDLKAVLPSIIKDPSYMKTKKEQIIELWEQGLNKSEITRKVGATYPYVNNVIELYKARKAIKEQSI